MVANDEMTAVPPRPSPPDEQQDDGRPVRARPRTWPWWLAIAAGLGSAVLAWTPGVEVDLQLFRISAHDPVPLGVVAAAAAAVALICRRRAALVVDLPYLIEDIRRHAWGWTAGVAAAALLYGILWNSWTIGGSDSHCYAAQARAFASGTVHLSQPLAASAPWPDATRTFAPVGFLPSDTTTGQLLPICAPGYSLLIAPLVLIWPPLQFLVAPLAAGLLVIATSAMAKHLVDDGLTGVGAGLFVAAAPVVLFQSTQPMTDVPAAAAIGGAAALAFGSTPRVRWAGAALGLGLLIRPNLLPVAVTFALFITWRGGWRALANLCSTLVPVASVVLLLNTLVYGAPWKTGYGDTSALFALAHLPVNLRHFTTWLLETMTPVVAIAVTAPWLLRATGSRRVFDAMALLAISVTVVACYIAYQPFEEWWYLRFLMPAVPLWCALTAAGLSSLFAPFRGVRSTLGLLVMAVVAIVCLREAGERGVFRLARTEQRLSATAHDLARHLPDAAAIAIQPNGAISYTLGQPVISWDSLPPESLESAIAWLRSRGLHPVIVVDQVEEAPFRRRFERTSASGALDWPPAVVVHRSVRVYDPSDRDRYLAAQPRPTRFVDPPKGRR